MWIQKRFGPEKLLSHLWVMTLILTWAALMDVINAGCLWQFLYPQLPIGTWNNFNQMSKSNFEVSIEMILSWDIRSIYKKFLNVHPIFFTTWNIQHSNLKLFFVTKSWKCSSWWIVFWRLQPKLKRLIIPFNKVVEKLGTI